MSLFVISQILIGFAICFDIVSFQYKEKSHILSCLLVSCSLISIHFFCLGYTTAGVLGIIAALRFITSIFSTSKVLMLLFIGATVLTAILTYQGALSIISCLGSCFGIMASFSDSDKRLRQLMLIGTSIWVVHNYLAGSPAAVIMEVIFICSNLVGYFRYYIRAPKKVLDS
jgi:hypothetical protein